MRMKSKNSCNWMGMTLEYGLRNGFSQNKSGDYGAGLLLSEHCLPLNHLQVYFALWKNFYSQSCARGRQESPQLFCHL